ncbi:hypothetical protein Ciccas_006327 [Cichlidogyrus casuarinus]|uniref:Uncharacterized protein n=1 Tax=Cichlidogyrus casuarinus TaxID=1844966 RepID=A0ABD2Q640_9PLAT
METEPLFKTHRRRKPQTLRNKDSIFKESSDLNKQVDNAEDELEMVSSIKDFQKLRKKQPGIDAEILSNGKKVKLDYDTKLKLDIKGNEEEEDQVRLSRNFASETNKRDEDAEMLKYIEAELAKRKGASEEDKVEENKITIDVLNHIPKDLRPSIGDVSEDMLSNQMLVGIPEVDLGVEAKMKNIEATEFAKQKLVKDRANKRKATDGDTDLVPCNVSVNFVQHSRWKDTAGVVELATEEEDHEAQQTMLRIFHSRRVPLPKGAVLKESVKEDEAVAAERRRLEAEKATDNMALQRFKKNAKDRKRF